MAKREERSRQSMLIQGYVPQSPSGAPNKATAALADMPARKEDVHMAPYAPPAYEEKLPKSIWVLFSALAGTAYLAYISYYLFVEMMKMPAGNTLEAATQAIGKSLTIMTIIPHVAVVLLAVFSNWLGWGFDRSWLMLGGGILYAVAGLMVLPYAPFVLPSLGLSLTGYVKIRQREQSEQWSAYTW